MGERMRFGSLFSGIGGIDLGLERAGMSCAFQVEIDDYCSRVLAKHWPDATRFKDIKEVTEDELRACGPVDLLAGGFPCQPHSLAGKRLASEDERDLWSEYVRIIRCTRPRWILAENVPGLLSSEAGRFFGRILRDLASLGFNAEWQVLSASDLGAPHLRERVFVVAYPNGERWEELDLATIASRPGRLAGLLDSMGYSDGMRELQPQRRIFNERRRPGNSGRWMSEPGMGRVAYGVPDGAHRIKALGNAVVPDGPEYIGRQIIAADAAPW